MKLIPGNRPPSKSPSKMRVAVTILAKGGRKRERRGLITHKASEIMDKPLAGLTLALIINKFKHKQANHDNAPGNHKERDPPRRLYFLYDNV
jgi:hypothetical protein